MIAEVKILAYALILQGIQYALMAIPANIELGPSKTFSPRDRKRLGGGLEDQLSEKTARLYRAMNNHFEGLILFAGAVVVIVLADKGTGFSLTCAWVYLIARILYVPAYYFGLTPWRSLIWFAGFLATFAMLFSALLF